MPKNDKITAPKIYQPKKDEVGDLAAAVRQAAKEKAPLRGDAKEKNRD